MITPAERRERLQRWRGRHASDELRQKVLYACHLKRSSAAARGLTESQRQTRMDFMNIWRMKTHHIDPEGAVAWSRKHGRIAIGWGRIGDVTEFQTQVDIREAIRSCYPTPQYSNNAHLGAPSLWDLCHTMQKGDLVILSGRAPRELVVEVIGDYKFVTEETPTQTNEGEYYSTS